MTELDYDDPPQIAASIHKTDQGYIATVQRNFADLKEAEKWILAIDKESDQ